MDVANVLRLTILALSVPAIAFDVRERRIPNFLTMPALAVGLAVFVLDTVRVGLQPDVLLVLPTLFLAWSADWIGGGDAKLLIALALTFGPWPVAVAAVAAGLAALVAGRPMPGAAFALPAALAVWLW